MAASKAITHLENGIEQQLEYLIWGIGHENQSDRLARG